MARIKGKQLDPTSEFVFSGSLAVTASEGLVAQITSSDGFSNPEDLINKQYADDLLILSRIGNSTFRDVQDMQDIFHSAGKTSGGVITAQAGFITASAGTGLIRSGTTTATDTLSYFDWTGFTAPISDGQRVYVGVDWNSGAPTVVTQSTDTWDYQLNFPLGTVVREGSGYHIINSPQAVGDHANAMIQRMYETQPVARDERGGGLILSITGSSGEVALTAGNLWDRLNKFSLSAIDTSASDTFDTYVTGVLDQTSLTAYPNTSYVSGANGLATLDAGRYGVVWFYVETDNHFIMVHGSSNAATVEDAKEETAPTELPDRVDELGKLVGRVIFLSGSYTSSEAQSAFTTVFQGGAASDHGNLVGLSDDDHTQYIRVDGTRAFSGDQSLGGNKITSVATPTAGTDAANKDYVDSKIQTEIIGGDGIWEPVESTIAVLTASVSNLQFISEGGSSSGSLAVDSGSLATGLAGSGLTATAGVLSIGQGPGITVSDLGVSASVDNSTIGFSSGQLTASATQFTVGDGLGSPSGTTFSVSPGGSLTLSASVDDSTLEIASDQIQIKDLGVTTAKLADDAVTRAKLGQGLTEVGTEFDANGTFLGQDSSGAITASWSPADFVISNGALFVGSLQNSKLDNSDFFISGSGISSGGAVLGGTASVNINVDGSTIEVGGDDALNVVAGGITETELATSVAGDGLTGGGGTPLAVATGTGLTIISDQVLLDTGSTVTFDSTANWVFTNPGSLTISGSVSNDYDAVNKLYVDSVANGLDWKDSVTALLVTSAALDTSLTSVDGVALSEGDRILVVNQTLAGTWPGASSADAANGIYISGSGGSPGWYRASDADTSAEVTAGLAVWVTSGSVYGDSAFVLVTDDPITLDTTDLQFTQFSGVGQIIAGPGLQKSAPNTLFISASDGSIDVNSDSINVAIPATGVPGIETVADGIRIAAAAAGDGLSGGGGSALAVNADGTSIVVALDTVGIASGGVETIHIDDAAVTNAKLANAGINIASSVGLTTDASVQLGGTLTINADIDETTITASAGTLEIKDAGVTNAKLANSGSYFVAGTGITLTPSLTNDFLDLGAALTASVDTSTFTSGDTPLAVSTTSAVGSSSSLARADHVHEAPALTKADKDLTPSATSGDGQDTGINITYTPALDSYVHLYVNGVQYTVGDGATSSDAYFSSDGGTTVLSIASVVAGSDLIWNGVSASFDLDANDEVSLDYLAFADN